MRGKICVFTPDFVFFFFWGHNQSFRSLSHTRSEAIINHFSHSESIINHFGHSHTCNPKSSFWFPLSATRPKRLPLSVTRSKQVTCTQMVTFISHMCQTGYPYQSHALIRLPLSVTRTTSSAHMTKLKISRQKRGMELKEENKRKDNSFSWNLGLSTMKEIFHAQNWLIARERNASLILVCMHL